MLASEPGKARANRGAFAIFPLSVGSKNEGELG